jgi:hypothetical protein
MLVPLSPTEPCSALIEAVKSRLPRPRTQQEHVDVKDADATLHLEDPDGPMLYAADTLSDVLPGAKEPVVVVFQVREVLTPFDWSRARPISSKAACRLSCPATSTSVLL